MSTPTPLSAARANAPEEGSSQTVKVQLKLREMIFSGELQAGARLTELAVVERLGVSRTPIRAALMRLEQEGLLQPWSSGGFAVRTFSESDVADAIELRGTLEGLAARVAAERGVDTEVLAQAKQCLAGIDQLLKALTLNDEAFSGYVRLNEEFHGLLGQLSGSAMLQRELERVGSLPFASPSGFVLAQENSPQARDMLVVAQDQHRQVLDAVERREGARAEAIMREHSRLAQRNLREAVRRPDTTRAPVMGMRLIRPN
jgi:GntR family transcriptional regulator of vanillate catabolism